MLVRANSLSEKQRPQPPLPFLPFPHQPGKGSRENLRFPRFIRQGQMKEMRSCSPRRAPGRPRLSPRAAPQAVGFDTRLRAWSCPARGNSPSVRGEKTLSQPPWATSTSPTSGSPQKRGFCGERRCKRSGVRFRQRRNRMKRSLFRRSRGNRGGRPLACRRVKVGRSPLFKRLQYSMHPPSAR